MNSNTNARLDHLSPEAGATASEAALSLCFAHQPDSNAPAIVMSNGELHRFGEPFVADIESIAFALSYINRYTGHVGAYSVAQHCVLVCDRLPDHLKLAGLLHDAPEALLGDVSKPLKNLLPEYQAIEAWYHRQFDVQFGVETEHPQVKEVDLRMLVTEAKFFGLPLENFPNVKPFDLRFTVWSPKIARFFFMSRFNELTSAR
ncbi:hypothetical protein ACPD0N_003166 [Vibrio cholerae]